ncbi:MAG TPA: hypothetical protein VI356_06200 [Myxococcales bacterium]
MKLLRRGALVVVALVVVLLGAVWLSLDHIVRTAVEREGTKSLRLATTLNTATVSLLGGKLGLHGLGIASPRGFSAPEMLEVGKVRVDVRYAELRKEPIHVDALTIEKPRLVIEQSGGALNFRKAMELLPQSDPNKPPMKLVIDRLDVKDAQVVIRPGLPGLSHEIVVPVPALTLKDLGHGKGADNGAAIKEVAMQVIGALAAKAAESDGVPGELKALLHLNVAQLAGSLGADAAKNLAAALPGGLGKKLPANPADLGKDAGKALQGMLPQGRRAPRR